MSTFPAVSYLYIAADLDGWHTIQYPGGGRGDVFSLLSVFGDVFIQGLYDLPSPRIPIHRFQYSST